MNITLTAKERSLLEDQKTHEEICVQKYANYANLASNQQLKALFQNHAQIEQEHLNTINQLLSGQVPALNQQSGGGTQQQQGQQQQPGGQQANYTQLQNTANMQSSDKDLCTDMLMTEKYVSNAYDTAIFEFRDTQVRDVLNHIQKEEQKHGEAIYKFMESNGLYSAQ